MVVDPAGALAWRLRRHALDPVAGASVPDVAARVVALRAWPLDQADLAICVRQQAPQPRALAQALEAREVIRAYAFRGGSYVFTHEVAWALQGVRGASRVWDSRRFQHQGGFEIEDWEPLRDALREALAPGPCTRADVSAFLAALPRLRQYAEAALGAGSDSLYKPLHWCGDICFGPDRDDQTTFRLLDEPQWPRQLDVDEAGRHAVVLYLGAYAPATVDNLTYWLTDGLSVPRPRVMQWLADLGDDLAQVSLDGATAYVLTRDVDELEASPPSESVRLLPGFDAWVANPGTADAVIVPPARRAPVSRGSNLVIRGGVVCGRWRVRAGALTVSWFAEAGPAPLAALESEVHRVASIRSASWDLTVEVA